MTFQWRIRRVPTSKYTCTFIRRTIRQSSTFARCRLLRPFAAPYCFQGQEKGNLPEEAALRTDRVLRKEAPSKSSHSEFATLLPFKAFRRAFPLARLRHAQDRPLRTRIADHAAQSAFGHDLFDIQRRNPGGTSFCGLRALDTLPHRRVSCSRQSTTERAEPHSVQKLLRSS